MALTGNKGEWSEIYVLFKLLAEGKVHAGDQDLTKIPDLLYPIIKILRKEKDSFRIDYSPQGSLVIIQDHNGEKLLKLPVALFHEKAELLLNAIQKGNNAFSIPEIEAFMKEVQCHKLKAPSSDKTDIHIVLHDYRTKINSEMGFSIKSQLGGPSTLLNASKATNVNYKIVDLKLTNEEIAQLNSISTPTKILDRVVEIEKRGGRFCFDKIDNTVFEHNLSMLDSSLPKILGELLLEQLRTKTNKLNALTEQVAASNPLRCISDKAFAFYSYKIKHFLSAVALGMMPATHWNGRYDANGGYLIVKSDGEILCYHFYDRNQFEDYLFANAYLERASSSRHEYASIIKENDGSLSFRLNLQIRLK